MPPSVARPILVGLLLVLPAAFPSGALAAAPWIEWDHATDRAISAPDDTGAAAPRARELSNGEILLVYHHGEALGNCGSRVTLRRSRDGGATWCQTQEIDGPGEKGLWGFSNPDFIELGKGRLMLVSAARGRAEPHASDVFLSECRRSSLRLRFSNDYGATWGPPRMIAAGRGRVWEPSIVRLPGGELQIFYANESPDLQEEGSTQCIESIRSVDGGLSWSAPSLVSEQRNCRNGMPAALALGSGHVVCAQEVVGLATSPWIADTLNGRTRQYHLAQTQYDFGAAPFLARAPDGGTLLAFHSQCRQTAYLKQSPGSWLFSDIFVQHGDAEATHFGPASCPWPTEEGLSGAFFPSMMVLRDGTLVVMASFITVHPDRSISTVIRWIKGRMPPAEARAPAGAGKTAASPLPATKSEPIPASDARLLSTALPHDDPEHRFGPPPGRESGRNSPGN